MRDGTSPTCPAQGIGETRTIGSAGTIARHTWDTMCPGVRPCRIGTSWGTSLRISADHFFAPPDRIDVTWISALHLSSSLRWLTKKTRGMKSLTLAPSKVRWKSETSSCHILRAPSHFPGPSPSRIYYRLLEDHTGRPVPTSPWMLRHHDSHHYANGPSHYRGEGRPSVTALGTAGHIQPTLVALSKSRQVLFSKKPHVLICQPPLPSILYRLYIRKAIKK